MKKEFFSPVTPGSTVLPEQGSTSVAPLSVLFPEGYERVQPLRLHKADNDPRASALAALSQVLSGKADSQAALDAALRSDRLVPTDKRLCTQLVYGVLRWLSRLELFASRFVRRPGKLPSEMRLVLLLALYEMVYLRIPHRASVSWGVEHVRNRFGQGLARVANGALRSMQRQISEYAEPENARDDASLSRRYAMPLWIVRLWRESCGLEAALAILSASQRTPPSGLRLNAAAPGWEAALAALQKEMATNGGRGRKKTPPEDDNSVEEVETTAREFQADAGAAAEPSLRAKEALFPLLISSCGLAFSGTLPWQARRLIEEGKASGQSAASYAVLQAFAPECWSQPVWDCCAGRGGKTMALLEQGVPVALASDRSENRLQALSRDYERLGLSDPPCPVLLPPPVERAAASERGEPACAPEMFGTVLVDAPCSGLGTLSRRPEIRLRRSPEDVAGLAALQRRILEAAWSRLLPGGSLIYLTCTVSPPENQNQIASFLGDHADARLCRELLPDPFSPLGEFFYGAQLRKEGAVPAP